MRKPLSRIAMLLVLLTLAGCASSHRSFRRGEVAAKTGDWDQAVLHYMEAVANDPDNIAYRAALIRAKVRASQEHFEKGKRYYEAKAYQRALLEFQQAVQLDPTNQYAAAELQRVRDLIRAAQESKDPNVDLQTLKERTRGVRPQPPMLNPRSDQPIDLDFPEPTSILDIYRALGQAFGINVLFDPNLKDQQISITLKQVTAQKALEVLMRAAGHFYKVEDEHTIIVVADTPQNRRAYEDLVIQTFFLSNADVKSVLTMLRSLVDAKKIATNEQLNAIILRDTADKVKVAERIIQANDKARAEVVIDVELLQVNTNRIRELGLAADYQVTASLDLGGEDVPLRLSDIGNLTTNNWVLTIPNFLFEFVKSQTDAQLLAKPQLRISEGEKARLVIGDRVPIPFTQFNTSNTVGSNVVPITSFQYQDVGIQIDIEPRVHHNKEISLKLRVEVSNISGFVDGSGGQQQPIIGTRTIESTIRLKDGETNLLAGLIRSDETSSKSGAPGLSDIPVLGRLFSNTSSTRQRTDVILTMTPHIIRTAEITEQDLLPIWVGTEANITFRGGSPRVESDVEGPFDTGGRTPEEIQEMIRQRIQRLPRGLRGEGEFGTEEPVEEEAPQGIDLVPPPLEEQPFGSPEEEEEESMPGLAASASELAEDLLALAALERGGAAPADLGPQAAGEAAPAQLTQVEAALASIITTTSAEPTVELRLVPHRLALAAGDTAEIRIEASALAPVSHLPVKLAFDPAVLAVERVEAGAFLGPEGESQVLADTSTPGELILGASRLGRVGGVAGSGTVVRIVFRAVAPGTSALTFTEARALDRELRRLEPVAAVPAAVEVTALARPEKEKRPESARPQI